MPGGDGTGPIGMGSMTGRAAGYCAGYRMPGYMNPGFGRGLWGAGRGRGGGWGRRGGFGAGRFGGAPLGAGHLPYGGVAPAPPTREQELETLKQQAAHFQGVLADIQTRIDELAAEAPSK